ncbi:TPA: hypothetical protein ACSP19_004114, partial [Aeromonas veronii]
ETKITTRFIETKIMTLPKKSNAVFKRCNFSLTQEVSDDIDELSMLPRTFKINRSEVVKAGIEALKMMPEAELIIFMKRVLLDQE